MLPDALGIIGLGNPGRSYARTRHNVGFRVIEALAEEAGVSLRSRAFHAKYGIAAFFNRRVYLLKPQTFMNDSGRCVQSFLDSTRLDPPNLLVVCDDLDLPLGKVRLRRSGGHGGHKGLRSVIERIGTSDFPRLRLGIGRPETDIDAVTYVLSPFTKDQQPLMDQALSQAVEAAKTFIASGIEAAMNQFN